MKRLLIAVIMLTALAASGTSFANASQLTVNSRGILAMGYNSCTDATLAVTGTGFVSGNQYSQVEISSIPASCDAESLAYVLYGASGAVYVTGTGTVTTGTVTLATPSNYDYSQVEGAALLIDSWGVAATWTAPTPPPPSPAAASCVVINNGGKETKDTCTVTLTNLTVDSSNEYAEFRIDVTGLPNNRGWRVTLDFQESWYPWQPVYLRRTAGGATYYAGCTAEPYSTVTVETSAFETAAAKAGASFFMARTTNPAPGFGPPGPVICP